MNRLLKLRVDGLPMGTPIYLILGGGWVIRGACSASHIEGFFTLLLGLVFLAIGLKKLREISVSFSKQLSDMRDKEAIGQASKMGTI
jgi:hypothetical protein